MSITHDCYPNATEALKAVKPILNKQLPTILDIPSTPETKGTKFSNPLKSLLIFAVGGAVATGAILLGPRVVEGIFQPSQASFGGDRILDIGVVSIPRANQKEAYELLSADLKKKLQQRFGDEVDVKLHVIETTEEKALQRAKQALKTQEWELAFTTVPMLAIAAVDNNYEFAARMFPDRSQNESVLFVRQDSPIRSLDDLNAKSTIALADFNSAPGFYMPIYDLYGKTLRVDMNNTTGESIQKVLSRQVDVGAGIAVRVRKSSDLRILHVSRAIPMSGVYLAPKLSNSDQKLVTELLLQAPSSIQKEAQYAAGSVVDYSEFRKITKRVEEVTRCSNWQENPVQLYCNSTEDGIIGKTNGYRSLDQTIDFTLQGIDGKTYRLVLPRAILNRDPNLDSPEALNFRKVIVKKIQPVVVDGVPELRITEPGQLNLVGERVLSTDSLTTPSVEPGRQ
jgi:ABC-type phosphate/phosphonate transport system substrate-binding protein